MCHLPLCNSALFLDNIRCLALIMIEFSLKVGLCIIELLKPEKNTSLGVLSLHCSPVEGASNLLLLLAEADLTFSAAVTSVNNFATLGK